MSHRFNHALLTMLLVSTLLHAQPAPVSLNKDTGQLLMHGKPYLMLGGELGNSSAGTAAQADTILPGLSRLHLNTVLVPIAWDQLEPREGTYDFALLDHWIDVARAQHLHLVLLWFGSWKNAFSEYAPDWVKADTRRFPRALAADGTPLEILSTFGTETLRADSRAFSALLTHLRDKDRDDATVLMIQIENEVGYLSPGGRDRSPEASRQFAAAVPAELKQKLLSGRLHLAPELAAHFHADGITWHDVFGETADEAFMAWRYATYIDAVAAAGKNEYALPIYMNAQLPAFLERPGDYPSGGPHPGNLDIYRALALHIDLYAPDIYWPEFQYWTTRYQVADNPLFIPEARLDPAPYNALYAYGAAQAIGFCPFGIDSLIRKPASPATATPEPQNSEPANSQPMIAQVYAALADLGDALPTAQAAGRTAGLVLHANSPRSTQTVALGSYLFSASLSRAWPSNALETNDGAMLVLETAPDEFLVIGTGLTVKVSRDPDGDNRIAGIASIDQLSSTGPGATVTARLNGDQSNQGRQLSLDPHAIGVYRLRMYTSPR